MGEERDRRPVMEARSLEPKQRVILKTPNHQKAGPQVCRNLTIQYSCWIKRRPEGAMPRGIRGIRFYQSVQNI